MPYPTDHYLDLHGLRFHYLDWENGEKEPLLLLHGFMGHAHVWDGFAPMARAHYHVLALDQRGHGESQWSEGRAYTIDDHFLDLSSFVEALRLSPLNLMGHSMGGRNALFYAALNPQKVARLVLVDARPGNHPDAAQALRRQMLTLPLAADSLDDVGKAIQSLYPSLSRETCIGLARHGYQPGPHGQYVPRYDRRMSLDAQRSGYAAEDLWPFLRNITCPALIVRGKESPFLSPEDARKMAGLLPRAELAEIPRATHLPMEENPGLFQKVVLDFLNRPL